MNCIGCCARHCLMQFYPANFDIRNYKLEIARKYKHDPNELRLTINRIIKNNAP
jgi:hypothetical protein